MPSGRRVRTFEQLAAVNLAGCDLERHDMALMAIFVSRGASGEFAAVAERSAPELRLVA